ncbi:hypothetical protein KSF78_0007312 [Schistosoma japonicum]|nr:hypothetical protein KSF78_0007312 [Schistosoma japonicum]
MNRYYVVLLVLYIVSIIATNVTKAANRQWRNSAHFQNTQSSIKCPLCIMMVNVARNLIVKSRSFQTIHYIIREMCSVVLSYSIVVRLVNIFLSDWIRYRFMLVGCHRKPRSIK